MRVVLAWVAVVVAFGASSAVESLSGRVAAEEQRISELERGVTALVRAPVPISPAGGPAVPLYLGGGSELPHLDEHKRLDVRHLMLVELERGGVTEVDYDDGSQVTRFVPPWQKAGFVVAPIEVLVAIRAAATPPLKGVELDLRVATAERGVHYVTLIHELDGRLTVTDIAGASVSPARSAPDETALRKRFGIGRLDAGQGRWSDAERQSLERALARLSPRELAQIRDVELRRESRPRRILPFKGACGLTAVEGSARWIEIYDCAFRDDDIVFTGSPNAPEKASVRIILHELGHALAAAPVVAFKRALEQLAADGKTSSAEYLELRAHTAVAEQPPLDALAIQLTKISERLHAAAQRLVDAHPTGPAVTAFSRVPGAASGVTSYGRESPAEAFAEAFSLFHADPDALRRISPEALEFFARGEHVVVSHVADSPSGM